MLPCLWWRVGAAIWPLIGVKRHWGPHCLTFKLKSNGVHHFTVKKWKKKKKIKCEALYLTFEWQIEVHPCHSSDKLFIDLKFIFYLLLFFITFSFKFILGFPSYLLMVKVFKLRSWKPRKQSQIKSYPFKLYI